MDLTRLLDRANLPTVAAGSKGALALRDFTTLKKNTVIFRHIST